MHTNIIGVIMLNKKGEGDISESPPTNYLILGELFVFLLLMIGTGYVILNNVPESENTIIAMDLGLVIETASASPYEIFYDYEPNTEEKDISIGQEDKVRVSGSGDDGEYFYFILKDVQVEPVLLSEVLTVSMYSSGKEISFGKQEVQPSCSNLPVLVVQNPRISIGIASSSTREEALFLKKVKALTKLYNRPANDPFEIVDNGGNLRVTIGFSRDDKKELNVKYDKSIEGFERISCYVLHHFSDTGGYFNDFNIIPAGNRVIDISFGPYLELKKSLRGDDIDKQMNDIAKAFGLALHDSLKRGFDSG